NIKIVRGREKTPGPLLLMNNSGVNVLKKADPTSTSRIMRGWPASILCLFVPVAVAVATLVAYGYGMRQKIRI
ncbi:hypothetical protein, partial [Jeotgalibaca porci]|uniref:hypothetical protein n=1 Tax=Jeotgalibaca porci TaxID=1868793 RepID=UPI0035A14A69